jgi:hypothetical protein
MPRPSRSAATRCAIVNMIRAERVRANWSEGALGAAGAFDRLASAA